MHPTTMFLLGFAAGALPLSILICAYYMRARKRVLKIKAAIEQYQDSKKAVGAACDQVYRKSG